MPVLYFLKFSQAIGSSRHEAAYYLGWARDDVTLERRIKDHRSGRGAAITKAAVASGARLEVVAVMPGNRDDERRIKNSHNHKRWLLRNESLHGWHVPTWLRLSDYVG